MLDEADGDVWSSRRDPRIRKPLNNIVRMNESGIPYLAPDVQLFYKAKSSRHKDEVDFAAVLPLLSTDERDWLVHAIEMSYGKLNSWLPPLNKGGR